ncbi:MAG TPA: hypothetical protein VFZ01_00580, partial [Geminicoccaceae bacterium]
MMFSRRRFLKTSAFVGAGTAASWAWHLKRAGAEPLAMGLSDPALQPKFVEPAANALDRAFLYNNFSGQGAPVADLSFTVRAGNTIQETGLVAPSGRRLRTALYGYGNDLITWPGQTSQVQKGDHETVVRWANEIEGRRHLLPVDT